MSKIIKTRVCTDAYDSKDAALKQGFALAYKQAKQNECTLDIVIPTLQTFNTSLLNFLGTGVREQLEKKKTYTLHGVYLALYSVTTAKKINTSDCLLILCVSDSFSNTLNTLDIKNCIVVPRKEENKMFWEKHFQIQMTNNG